MYIDALKDLIKDLVNLCGEETDSTKAVAELDLLNKKIEKLEKIENLSSYEKVDLDVAEIRKQYWEKSAAYIGDRILKGFENGEDKESLIALFNILYDRAYSSFKELNTSILEANGKNIWDIINKKKVELIKFKAKNVEPDGNVSYSNVAEHYKSKKSLIENVISSLKEKKVIVDETIALYNNIISRIAEEIKNNNNILISYNEKKYSMAYRLCSETDYYEINEEIEKLREIKTFNESQLKVFNLELEEFLKEKENIEKEIALKQEELLKTEERLEEFRNNTLEGEYVSKEKVVSYKFDVKQKELDLQKLDLQKNLLYVNLERIKEMVLEILTKYSGTSEINTLEGEFTPEEIKEIENMMNLLSISKEEAVKTFEINKERKKEEEKISEYMDEFDFSLEEAKEALKNELPEKRFWDVEGA